MDNNLLRFLKETKIDLTKAYLEPDSGSAYTDNVFDINPKDFLRFAKFDFSQKDERGLINSLTNSKRAIDCQIDEVLSKFGVNQDNFKEATDKFIAHFHFTNDIPNKLKFIQALNFAPSLLISRTRNLRNRLEHLYQKPSENEVNEALDVADLFIRSVSSYLKMQTEEFTITDEKNYDAKKPRHCKNGIAFSFNQKTKSFELGKIISDKIVENVTITSINIEYFGIVRLMNSIYDDEFELDETFKIVLRLIEHPMPSEKASIIQI